MSTGRDLVTASLRLMNGAQGGETPDASSANDALSALNRMLGTWNAQLGSIYCETQESFTLTASTAGYTWGTGGTLNSARPQQVLQASIRMGSAPNTADYLLTIITNQAYQEITDKTVGVSLPMYMAILPSYPLMTVTMWPIPDQNYTLRTTSKKPLTAITLDTTISYPEGYEEAIIYNLAKRLGLEWGTGGDAGINAIADETKNAIWQQALTPEIMELDPYLPTVRRTAGWDWRTGI